MILKVNKDIIQDAINITNGIYAPLNGFLRASDLKSVLYDMRLKGGEIWSIPIVLDINKNDYRKLKNQRHIILTDKDGTQQIILNNIEIYHYNKKEFVRKVFGTLDEKHPGIESVNNMGRRRYRVSKN